MNESSRRCNKSCRLQPIHSKCSDFSFVWSRLPRTTLPTAPKDRMQSVKPTLAFERGDPWQNFGLSKTGFCQFRCSLLWIDWRLQLHSVVSVKGQTPRSTASLLCGQKCREFQRFEQALLCCGNPEDKKVEVCRSRDHAMKTGGTPFLLAAQAMTRVLGAVKQDSEKLGESAD